jgi:hypothetical protein
MLRGVNCYFHLQEYEKVLDLVKDIILATDLAHHLKIIGQLKSLTDGNVIVLVLLNSINVVKIIKMIVYIMENSTLSDAPDTIVDKLNF